MRSNRLPPYLQEPIWIQLAQAIDEVFNPNIDDGIGKLRDLSALEHIHPRNRHKIGHELLTIGDGNDADGKPWIDKRLRVKQATDLGFTFSDSNSVPLNFYEALVSQGPVYWGEAGTRSMASFLGFLLNADIKIMPLYTIDYVEFVDTIPDGASQVYSGGDYYLTSHVNIEVNGNISATINVAQLLDLFYMIAPIHLVVNSAQISFSQTIAEVNIAIAGRIMLWESDATPTPDAIAAVGGRMHIWDPTSTLVL